jgi:hypothetical protein
LLDIWASHGEKKKKTDWKIENRFADPSPATHPVNTDET